MIKNDWATLKSISPLIFNLIKKEEYLNYDTGEYLLSSGIKMKVSSYFTDYRENRRFESHRRYIDIQLMVRGTELCFVESIDLLSPISDYDEANDIIFYKDNNADQKFVLSDGSFLIFNSEDAHMPCICLNKPTNVKKIVFKVPLSQKGIIL